MTTFQAVRFGQPEFWWLLLVPLLLIVAWVWWWRFRSRVVASLSGRGLLPRMVERAGLGRRVAVGVLLLVALELLALAAMRPRYGLKEVTVGGRGVDVAIVLDISRSMKAADVAPDRLTASVMEISRLLDATRGNRYSLVPFAGIAFVQTPLTLDTEVIKQYLEDLRVTDMPVPGTALGRALKTAQTALGVRGDETAGSIHKAVVLFTDGENHEGDPTTVAAELANRGVRLLTVGVGTPAGEPIPILDEDGNVTGTAREKDGVTPVMSKLNEELLGQLAKQTGGKYFGLRPGNDVAASLIAELDALEKAEYQMAVDRLMEDRFQYPLAAALVLAVLAFLLLGGARVRQAAAVGALALCLVPGAAQAKSFFEMAHGGVAKALEQLAAGQSGDAATALEQIATELPNRPDVQFNLALARSVTGQHKEALDAIDAALSALGNARDVHPDWPTQQRLLHAKGTILMHQGRRLGDEKKDLKEVRAVYRQAVDALVQAILLDPGAEDSRRNLELASMAAYPPCARMDDPNEPNNVREEAKFLPPDPATGKVTQELLLCPGDEDHFRLPIQPGETVIASVLKQMPVEGKPGEPAMVDLALMDGTGRILRAAGKQVRWRADAAGDLFFQVTGPRDEDGVSYVIDLAVIPPCPAGDDRMEDNDTREAARAIEDGDLPGRICGMDEDWFSYTEKQGTQKQVVLAFEVGEGPLELEVFSADGAPLDIRRQDGEAGVALDATLPKAEQDAPFLIRVHGGGAEGFYQLSVKDPSGGQKQPQEDQQPQDQDQPPQEQPQEQQPQEQQKPQPKSGAMREMLEALDRNDENLEAQEALRQSPYREYMPQKDW